MLFRRKNSRTQVDRESETKLRKIKLLKLVSSSSQNNLREFVRKKLIELLGMLGSKIVGLILKQIQVYSSINKS
jgi:hypothetical protein